MTNVILVLIDIKSEEALKIKLAT